MAALMLKLFRRGIFFVLSAPSGAGKTTLYRGVMKQLSDMTYSISYTTRRPRSGETDGVDYCFVGRPVFEEMIGAGEFVEWAEVHGELYGTHRRTLQATLEAGKDIILDIDVQGAQQLRESFNKGVFIFVFPPSLDELEKRLRGRDTDSDEVINRRLCIATKEMALYKNYDYLIINDDLAQATSSVIHIIQAERLNMKHLDVSAISSHFTLTC